MGLFASIQAGQAQGRQIRMDRMKMQQQERAMQQEQTIGNLSQQYMRDPNPQTISQIAAFSPEKAQVLMKAQNQIMTNKAKSIKSITNTYANASESQKDALFPELIKRAQKMGVNTRDMPLERNKDTAEQINELMQREAQKADQFLGADRKLGAIPEGHYFENDTGKLKKMEGYAKEDETEYGKVPEGHYLDKSTGQLKRMGGFKPTQEQGKPPPGYRWTQQGKLEAIPGGPAEKISGEVAGKIALYEGGLSDVKSFRDYLFNKDGKLNRPFIAKMNTPFGAGRFGDVRDAHSKISNAIEAKLRAETGAAATQDEIDRNIEKFMPSIRDNERTVNNKMDRLEKFLSRAIEISEKGRTQQKTKNMSGMSDEELLGGF